MWLKKIMNSDRPNFEPPVLDLDELIATALEERAELRSLRKSLDSRMLNERVAKRQRKHQLDFDANYTPIGTDVDQGVFVNGPDGIPGTEDDGFIVTDASSLGGSFSNLGDDHYWSAKLTYRIPVGNRAANANYARARLTREQTEVDIANQEQTIRVEVRIAARAVESGWKRVEAARVNTTLQEKKLDAEQKKFDNGMSTSFEVLTFQNDLADAELAQIRAALDYIKALAALETATGTLIESRGLVLAGMD
jgi:outer membrane protein TolC